LPRVTKEVKPDYTNEAKEKRIAGVVMMNVVVLADGTAGDVTVTRSLDSVYGLDANAVKAMKQWQFAPGTKDGRAVAVAISVEMTFALK
jgi:protein TonB